MSDNYPLGYDVPNPLNGGATNAYALEYKKVNPNTGEVETRVAVDTTSLAGGHFLNTLRMDEVYALLVRMITILQQVAVAQADQLKFLTSWQRAYTDRMAGVHTFVARNGDASFISGTDTDAGTARQDLNQVNTVFTEQDRSWSQLAGDTAKALQANISQTQDAVNQQSNMATSIIQQFNTILASINRM